MQQATSHLYPLSIFTSLQASGSTNKWIYFLVLTQTNKRLSRILIGSIFLYLYAFVAMKRSKFPLFFQRDFDDYWDTNKNGRLDEDEILRILQETIHVSKACTIGLIRSCDIDGNPGISKQEWFTCFKTEGTSVRQIYITALVFLNQFYLILIKPVSVTPIANSGRD